MRAAVWLVLALALAVAKHGRARPYEATADGSRSPSTSPQFPTSFYAYVVDASSTAGDLPLSYGLFFDAVGYRRRMDLPSVDGANASSAAAHNTSLIQVFDQGVNGANKTGLANVTLLHHGMQLALNTVARGQGNLARLVLPPMQLNGTGVVRGVACTVWVTTVGTSKLTIWSPVGTTLLARAWLGTHTRVDFVGMVPGVHEWDWPWATPRDYSTRAVHSQNATCFWCDLWKPAQIKGQDGGESIWWQDGAQRRAFWFYGDTVMPVHWPTNTLLMVNATAEGKVTGARYLVNSTSGRAVSAVPPFPAPAAGQDCYHLWLGAGVAARGTMYVHFQQLYAGGANHPSCKPLGGDTGFGMVTAPLGATHFNAVTDPAAGGSFTRFPYLTDACLFPDGGDDYVYSYELDSPTHAVYLRRVDVSSITDPAEYDVWVGSHNGSPLWQRVAGANHTGPRVPFLRGMSNQVTVQVFPYLSGVVMLTTSGPPDDFSIDSTPNASGIYVRVAPNAWGPFSAPFPVHTRVNNPSQSWYCPYMHPALNRRLPNGEGAVMPFTYSVAVGWGVNPLVDVTFTET